MTIILNDPTWWPVINSNRISSYVAVASVIIVMYDWVLTFGQEVELVWRQRWSLMTAMYLGALPGNLICCPDHPERASDHLADRYSESSAQMPTILLQLIRVPYVGLLEETILSGTYQCSIGIVEQFTLLDSITWILGTVWEVLVLCLSVWIVVKHFRELRQHSAGGIIIADCFAVLMKTHVLYFASFVAVSFLQLITQFSPMFLTDQYSLKAHVYFGLLQILEAVQSFVLGPRLILGVRESNAKLVTNSNTATAMTSIAFQERVHISTDNGV
ncbi:uncharacterized protein HD556DRAFT_1445221 [Suillus plorans]|uniref:DUF6533 domain-containing protein n=1 Tax=Suillus plorans TaxID=116603 RepID=A0A9P7AKZ7_9AGAM|nr:uncharacterized protein HD556DRAFT_1445221 [Suillus plorans]KAG1791588.1 hypothetical protein HD556DRAFT_1445221 [Suillus plorans]